MATPQSVYGLLRARNTMKGAYFGIELEIEGVSPDSTEDASMLQHSRVIEDGSLRNGIEIVTNPLRFSEVQVFAGLYEQWAREASPVLSERCSTHIHVNVQDLTYEQLRSFLWLSIAVEQVLLEYCSTMRRNNTYCYTTNKSVNTAAWYRELLYRSKDNDNLSQFLQRGTPKYCAIGLFRFADYGTVEFRMFDGTVTANHIVTWCSMIDSLRDLAVQYTVEELRDRKLRDGVLSLLTTTVLEQRGEIPDDRLSTLLNRGIEMANDITRKPMTLDQLLNVHRTLFPHKAPDSIERGQFGPKLVALLEQGGLASVQAHLSKFNRGEFEDAYGASNALFVLFNELSSNPVLAADIVITVRSAYYS